jgi:hypothetical protein
MRPDPGGIAYGTITVGGVLASESAIRETYASTLGGAMLALVLYWLAHSYAEFTRQRARSEEPLQPSGLARIVAGELSVLVGALVPVAVLALCGVFGVSLADGDTAATWAAAGMVVAIEFGLGVREHLSGRELAFQSGLGLVLGLLVIGLRALLH